MDKNELAQWRNDSIEQAYESLMLDILSQYSGYVAFAGPVAERN